MVAARGVTTIEAMAAAAGAGSAGAAGSGPERASCGARATDWALITLYPGPGLLHRGWRVAAVGDAPLRAPTLAAATGSGRRSESRALKSTSRSDICARTRPPWRGERGDGGMDEGSEEDSSEGGRTIRP